MRQNTQTATSCNKMWAYFPEAEHWALTRSYGRLRQPEEPVSDIEHLFHSAHNVQKQGRRFI